jgi:cell division protein FtsL
MSEPKVNEKKMVRRSVAIALGIICIVLVAGLVGGFGYFILTINDKDNTISSLNTQISSKDSQISQLNTQISDQNNTIFSLNSTLANADSQISQLNSNATNLQSQVNNLTDILNLGKSTTLYNGTVTIVPSTELAMLEENVPYAGYVSVQVSSSQSNATVIITVVWDYYPVLRYQNDFNLGSSGTAIFPVLPPSMVVYFFDPKLTGFNSELANVTITYYY